MIFISYTHKDELFIEPIAQKLLPIVGRDNIFYDRWAIQPGDGIIAKMNDGLEKCKFFFLFLSKNSLSSELVKLEWENALLKHAKKQLTFIIVKLDDCLLPAILMQSLFIDYFGQGPENAIRQIIDVIQGKNTYCPRESLYYHNVRAYLQWNSGTLTIEFRAETYMEPFSRYLILVNNEKDDICWTAVGESVSESKFTAFIYDNGIFCGQACPAIFIARDTPTSPGFPFIVNLAPKGGKVINFVDTMRAFSREIFQAIPVIR